MKRKVNWEDVIPLMYEFKDAALARFCGVSRERVRQVRERYSIPSIGGRASYQNLLTGRVNCCLPGGSRKTEKTLAAMKFIKHEFQKGKLDSEIAPLVGLDKGTVANYRRMLNLTK